MRLAISLSGLANVYQTQGRYAEAEPLYNRSVAIAEKAMGSNNRAVAAILDKLAAVCHALGHSDAHAPVPSPQVKPRRKRPCAS